jgi:hypothetical protein
MKITKAKLQQIIKEEYEKAVQERFSAAMNRALKHPTKTLEQVWAIINPRMVGGGCFNTLRVHGEGEAYKKCLEDEALNKPKIALWKLSKVYELIGATPYTFTPTPIPTTPELVDEVMGKVIQITQAGLGTKTEEAAQKALFQIARLLNSIRLKDNSDNAALKERLDSTTPLWKQSTWNHPNPAVRAAVSQTANKIQDILDGDYPKNPEGFHRVLQRRLAAIEKLLTVPAGSERVDLKPKDEPAEKEQGDSALKERLTTGPGGTAELWMRLKTIIKLIGGEKAEMRVGSMNVSQVYDKVKEIINAPDEPAEEEQ